MCYFKAGVANSAACRSKTGRVNRGRVGGGGALPIFRVHIAQFYAGKRVEVGLEKKGLFFEKEAF